MNEQNYGYSAPPGYMMPPKPKNVYNKADIILAFLLIPISFAIVRAMGASEFPLGNLICSVIIFVISAFYLKKQGVKLTAHRFSFALAISALLFSVGLVLTSNPALQAFISLIIAASYIYWVFAATGNSSEKLPSAIFPLEMLKAAFVMSFGGMGYMIEAFSGAKKSKKIGKNLLLVMAGLALALIPSMIAFALLSYDESFRNLTRNLLDFNLYDTAKLISDIIMTLPLSLLLFGMLYSGRNRKYDNVLSAESCERISSVFRFAPSVLAVSATVPFILIYSVFFVSQIDYYLSAFSGALPEGLSYAEYARSGFFELCAVSVINLLVILCTSVFCRMNAKGKPPVTLRAVNFLLSLLTLILIATAISKMVLYIDTYGLTSKRVLASAFMIFLGIVFAALLLRQLAGRINIILISLIALLIISGMLAFADVDRVIANYNTERYLEGTLDTFDPMMLPELGDAGYICLHRIATETKNDAMAFKAEELLRREAVLRDAEKTSVFSLTLPKLKADSILKKYK